MPKRAIYRLTIADVQYIAYRFAVEFFKWDEPIPPFETRFPQVLESCVNTPYTTFSRKSFYLGVNKKAAILFYLMIKNHPFANGNKRLAVATLLYFLFQNGLWIKTSNELMYEFARDVAQSDPKQKDNILRDIEKFLRKNCIKR